MDDCFRERAVEWFDRQTSYIEDRIMRVNGNAFVASAVNVGIVAVSEFIEPGFESIPNAVVMGSAGVVLGS